MSYRSDQKFRLGIVLLVGAGLVPASVGIYFYFKLFSSLSWEHWLSVFQGRPYSNADKPPVGPYFYTLGHLAFTNLIATGVTISCLSWFAIRRMQRWAWFMLAWILLWVGINDLILSIWIYRKKGDFVPLPLLPLFLGALGLLLTRRLVRQRRARASGAK